MTDQLEAAIKIVDTYMELSMIPDPEGAAAYVSDDFELIFTGARRFDSPAGSTGFNAKRYQWVKKRILRRHAALDPASGNIHVYCSGYLYGAWPDGTAFDNNRFMDALVIRDGKIISLNVWNDSAEWRLAEAGLAEAPL